MTEQELVKKAMEDIDHHCDGPVTPLVILYRACLLARYKNYEPHICSEAALNVMQEYGYAAVDEE